MQNIKCTFFFNLILILTIALVSNNYPHFKYREMKLRDSRTCSRSANKWLSQELNP